MVFSTPLFLCLYLPFALALFHLSPRIARLAVLTAVSLFFYAWSDPRFLLVLLWTCVVDYAAGCLLAGETPLRLGPRGRRLVLVLSLANSIGLLVFFKYAAALMGFWQSLSDTSPSAAAHWHIALPAGISFYTFESISYVLDVYRRDGATAAAIFPRSGSKSDLEAAGRVGVMGHVRGFIAFLCYIAQFPHLVAGPIIRFREIGHQLLKPQTSVNRFGRGTVRFCLGLGKKVLIADTLAPVVDTIFGGSVAHAGYVWVGALAFALQIYFDFSGYSDMAIGLAQMLGFRFPENFDAPYRALSLADFWRRWHMTLSRWLRDYVYIPLGGNRRGPARTGLNLLVTMTLAGVWHGAGGGFVIWGALHGSMLALERLCFPGSPVSWLERLVRRLLLMSFLLVSWVFFRAGDGMTGLFLVSVMFNPWALHPEWHTAAQLSSPTFLAALAVGVCVVAFAPTSQRLARRPTLMTVVASGLIFGVALLTLLLRTSTPFLYFRF